MSCSSRFSEGFHYFKGRVALHAILRALGVGAGDEVIVSGFTCLGVPLPILDLHARPVYSDIETSTYNIDVSRLEGLITPRTKAIVAQHTYGIPLPMPAVMTIARRAGLAVIEDCCHTVSSAIEGKPVGTFGDAAFSSYEWGKPLVLGCGGSATVNDADLREKLAAVYRESHAPTPTETLRIRLERVAYRTFYRPSWFWGIRRMFRLAGRLGLTVPTFDQPEVRGRMKHADKRMPRFAVGILKAEWTRLEERRRQAQRLAALYETSLREIGVAGPTAPDEASVVYSRYPLQARDKQRVLHEAMRSGVEIGDWFATPIHPLQRPQWSQVAYVPGTCPVAEQTAERIVTLPLHRKVRPSDVERTLEFVARMKREGHL